MDLELRPITEDEHPAWNRHIARAFGFHNDEMVIAAWRSVTELDRTLAAFDRGEIVGTAGAFSFEMALPGGATTPVGAVTGVSVRATHRRRGVLSQMMTRQLVDIAERGESMAVLTASETVIYGRFGYGLASHLWEWKIATDGTTLSSPSAATGRVRLIDKEEAAKILPGVRDRAWRRHPGELAWSQAWWDKWFLDRREDRDGASPLFFAVHESDSGEADGYLAWRTKPGWVGGLPDGELVVVQLYGVDEEIEAALWELALSVDLVRTVSASDRPVEEPLRWRLADARRLQVTHVVDHLWIRILDVERALSARELGADDRLVLDVADDLRPQSAGTYAVSPGACTRTDAPADLSMHVRDLGALYLGGVSATTLARAGRVRGDARALHRADLLFSSSQTPWCSTGF